VAYGTLENIDVTDLDFVDQLSELQDGLEELRGYL
jgi:hypothetical protein